MHKKDLTQIVLSLQNKPEKASNFNTEMLDEMPKLNGKFNKLRSDVYFTKIVKTYFKTDLLISNINTGQMPSIQGENA